MHTSNGLSRAHSAGLEPPGGPRPSFDVRQQVFDNTRMELILIHTSGYKLSFDRNRDKRMARV